MDLTTTTVLITGANRGIGYALVRELRQRGTRRIYRLNPTAVAALRVRRGWCQPAG